MTNVLLINPTEEKPKKKTKKIHFPSLALQAVAGSFPKNVNVDLIDEQIDEIPVNDYDLVGITVNMSCKAPHAYELATELRKAGKKVILGGIHVSSLPDEAEKYADSIVVGEIENLGQKIISDLESGNLQKRYISLYPDVNLSKPRRDFFSKQDSFKRYRVPNLIETSRGCPNDCSFCSVTKQYGPKHRLKDIVNVLDEIKQGQMQNGDIAFMDNNLIGSPHEYERAKEFFKALIPLNLKWFGQFDTRIGEDIELIKLMAESGCKAAFIGFESLSLEGQESIKKEWNKQDKFSSFCETLHQYGIGIIGSFILGLDSDTEKVFSANVKFAKKNALETMLLTKLTPLPGTVLFSELKETGRLVYPESAYPEAWRYHDGEHTVFKPKKMSAETLDEGFKWAYKEFYGSSILPPIDIFRRSKAYSKLFIPLNLAFWNYARKL